MHGEESNKSGLTAMGEKGEEALTALKFYQNIMFNLVKQE